MSNRVVDLAVRISADVADDVARKFDDVGGAASHMADDIAESGERGAAGLDRMGGASEGLDDKFGRAAGAAGALSSGADLIGNEKASAALMAMALATDFFSGVGQVGILVTEGLSAAQSENVIVSKAQAAATKATTVAQAALNAVIEANPILLIVVGIALAVAAFILLYKHSDAFRTLVQKTGDIGKRALGLIVGILGDVIDWIGRVISKFSFLGTAVRAYVDVIKFEINLVLDVIKFLVDHVDDAGKAWGKFKDNAVSAGKTISDKVSGFFHTLMKPIQTVIDLVDSLFDKIGDLIDKLKSIPHPDLNPFNKAAGPGAPGSSGGGETVTVTVDMPVMINLPTSDPTTAGQAIVTALTGLADRLGITVAQLLDENGIG